MAFAIACSLSVPSGSLGTMRGWIPPRADIPPTSLRKIWLWSPKISHSITVDNLKTEDDDTSQDLSKNEFMASDGKNYKFLGSQWSEILPSGKFGRLARKNISKELNKLADRNP